MTYTEADRIAVALSEYGWDAEVVSCGLGSAVAIYMSHARHLRPDKTSYITDFAKGATYCAGIGKTV